jgi:hypothetical protein
LFVCLIGSPRGPLIGKPHGLDNGKVTGASALDLLEGGAHRNVQGKFPG